MIMMNFNHFIQVVCIMHHSYSNETNTLTYSMSRASNSDSSHFVWVATKYENLKKNQMKIKALSKSKPMRNTVIGANIIHQSGLLLWSCQKLEKNGKTF